MASKILYDTRDNEIKRCQPEPHGSAGMPSFEGLCKSARISENDKQYMETCITERDILTNQAIEELRIIENETIKKPKVEISANKQEVVLSNNPEFTVTVNIYDTINNDNFSSVDILINDVSFSIDITDNSGDKVIELSEADTYIIACDDDRFVSQVVEVVAVE
jgi:hypothetical protein